jgi:predicted transposase/invertase (TIGR01784 family)
VFIGKNLFNQFFNFMTEILQSTYMNPLTDFGFKKLFAEESNKDLLIDFLNEIIKEEGCITDIEYQQTLQLGGTKEDRKAIFDIFCKNEKGEFFVVEMQKAKQTHFVDRSLFYATFPIQKQAPQGPWKFELKSVYLVGILDFEYFDGTECIERVYLARERNRGWFSKKLNFTFVELPKFKKPIEELETNADRWLFCLKNLALLNSRPVEVQGRIFERLFKLAEIKKLTPQDMENYHKSVMEYADVRDCMDCARDEGRIEGRSEGRSEGINLIAKNLLNLHFPVNDIAKATGLTCDQILSL